MSPETTSPPSPPPTPSTSIAPTSPSSTLSENKIITTNTDPVNTDIIPVTTSTSSSATIIPSKDSDSKTHTHTTDPVTKQQTKSVHDTVTDTHKSSEKTHQVSKTTNTQDTTSTSESSDNTKSNPTDFSRHDDDEKKFPGYRRPEDRPLPENTRSPDSSNSNGKTGVVIGAVIGSLIGLAIFSAIMAIVNKCKCCGDRKKKPEFEDYGLADTDFPRNRLSAVQNMSVAPNSISPAIAFPNNQANYYGKEEENTGYMAPYQVVDHNNNYYYENNAYPVHEADAGYYTNASHQENYYENQVHIYPDQYHHNATFNKPDQITKDK